MPLTRTGARKGGGYLTGVADRLFSRPDTASVRLMAIILATVVSITTGIMAVNPRAKPEALPPPVPNPVTAQAPKPADSGLPAQAVAPVPTKDAPPPPATKDAVAIPTDRGRRLTRAQVQAVMIEAGWPRSQIATGVAVSTGESGRIPNRRGTTARVGVDLGLFQINSYYWRKDLARIDWRNPVQNARLALKIYRQSGWNAWYAYRSHRSSYSRATIPDPGSTRGIVER